MSIQSFASETDQYFAWIHGVPDSTEALNARVNSVIARELAKANLRPPGKRLSCENLALRLGDAVGGDAMKMEFVPGQLGSIPVMPESDADRALYHRESYLGPVQVRDFTFMLASSPSLQVDGIYLGIDKLEHFFSTGAKVYRHYLASRKSGASPALAEQAALDYAIWTENTYLGYESDGVFAFADLEADYQGLVLFREWCEGDQPGLAQDESGWRLVRPFEFHGRLNPYFDEGFNPSVRRPAYYEYTRGRVRQYYCSHQDDARFAEIHAGYERRLAEMPEAQRATAERLRTRIAAAIASGEAPDPTPFRLASLCADEPMAVPLHHTPRRR